MTTMDMSWWRTCATPDGTPEAHHREWTNMVAGRGMTWAWVRYITMNDDPDDAWHHRTKAFWSCENMCCCDEYLPAWGFDVEWANMYLGGPGPYLWCPHCRELCAEVLEYRRPPAPYDVDGDGWTYRAIGPCEDPEALEAALPGGNGFVSEDRARLYLHNHGLDPRPEGATCTCLG